MLEIGYDCVMKSGVMLLNKFVIFEWFFLGFIGNQVNQFMGFQLKQQVGFLINGYLIIDNCNKVIIVICLGDVLGKYVFDFFFVVVCLFEVLFNCVYVYYLLNIVFGDVYFLMESSIFLFLNY